MGKRSRRRTEDQPARSEAPAVGPPAERAASERPPEQAAAEPTPGSAPSRPLPDPTGRAAWILLETYRWVVQHAEAPGPEHWEDLPDFPSSAEVEELFGSWEHLWDAAGLYDAPYFKALEDADVEHEQLAERRDATQREAARLRAEAERREAQMRELRRQAERSREKADAERAQLQDARARADAAERHAQTAERRAEEAERRVADGGDGAATGEIPSE